MSISEADAAAFESLFSVYRGIAAPPERFAFACENPALISSDFLRDIANHFQDDPEARRDERFERLAELDGIRRAIARDASKYPAGRGPIEAEATRVANGETSLKTAIARVRRPEFGMHLAPVYAHALTWRAEQLATGNEAGIAMLWMRLLAEGCLATCPGQSFSEKLDIAAVGFIQVAGVALGSVPDGEMMHAAEALGRELLDRLTAPAPDSRRGGLLHALGVVHSDPVSGPSGLGVDETTRRHQLRSLEAVKGPALARQHQQQFPFPSTIDALQTALGYYERALPDLSGAARGITLKAIVQTMAHLSRVKDEGVDLARVTELCKEALPLLPRGEYQQRALIALMASFGLEAGGERGSALPADFRITSPEDVLELQASIASSDPVRALKVLMDAKDMFHNAATEMQRRRRFLAMSRLIPRAHGGALEAPSEGSFKDVLNRALKTADDEAWPVDRLAATLVWFAQHSDASNDEETGLRLLTVAAQKSEVIAAYQEAVAFLYANLHIGMAVNAVNTGDPGAAVKHYGEAVTPMLRLGMPSTVFELLGRMAVMAARPGGDRVLAVVLALAPIAFEIDRELATAGDEALEDVYQNALGNLGDTVTSTSIAMLLQLAKGARFSAMLRQGPAFDWRGDQTAVELSADIARLQDRIGLDHEFDPMSEVLLVSPSGGSGARDGETDADRLANLQRSFDRHVTQLLVKNVRSSVILDPEIIGRLLGPNTVLLDYYFAAHDEKQFAVYIVAYTHEDIAIFKNVAPGDVKQHTVSSEGVEAIVNTIGFVTRRLRQSIELDPDMGVLHSDARKALADDFHLLLGTPAWDYLEQLRQAGKTHLCIRPHGALRYYPLQLLGPGDQDLAQHWTVTSIPSLECLLQAEPESRSSLQVLGLSYAGGIPFPLAELRGAHREVRAIASASGTNPLLDDAVTEQSVFEALKENRFVHLCAHGANNAESPLFQHLFVTPGHASDGRICAYEIFGHDLRGLELLSLGSCDSALGRFDAGDNLSGLPAAFLAAGVSSIVGSLWQLSDEAAATFFPRLYAELAQGASRVDAFRRAQLAVREAFPEPRDWAAFSYIGAWSRPDPALLAEKGPYIKLEG